MSKPSEAGVANLFAPHLQSDEALATTAYGVKQPHILLIVFFMLLGILPGLIVVLVMTKYYRVGLTDRRLMIIKTGTMKSLHEKGRIEFDLSDLKMAHVATSVGPIFVNIRITDHDRKFAAKFHRSYSKTNRLNAIAIAEALSAGAPN